jgi:hypothetical protein
MFWRSIIGSAIIVSLTAAIDVSSANEVSAVVAAFKSRAYGPENEGCTTTGRTLKPGDDWLERLKNGKPGDLFLLRGGTYKLNSTLSLPNGEPDSPIVIQPYNCEAVTLLGVSDNPGIGTTMLPGKYNIIAGLRIESATHETSIEIKGAVRNVEFRNNAIYGGRNDAIRIVGGVSNIVFSGNDINSGPGQLRGITGSSGGHVFVIGNREKESPDRVRLVRNKIRGSYFGDITKGDDVIAVVAGENIVIEDNFITENYNIEQVIDIKSRGSQTPVTIRGNALYDNFLGTHGGQDGGFAAAQTSCEIIIGDHDAPPELRQHMIDSNYLQRGICIGASQRSGSALIRNNIVHANATTTPGAIFNRVYNTVVTNNTFYRGGFKIGRSKGCIPAGQLVFRNNIFFETFVKDQTTRCPSNLYTVANNILYRLPSRFERGAQASNTSADPSFVNPTAGDFRLRADSYAALSGERKADIGAAITVPTR